MYSEVLKYKLDVHDALFRVDVDQTDASVGFTGIDYVIGGVAVVPHFGKYYGFCEYTESIVNVTDACPYWYIPKKRLKLMKPKYKT